MDIKEYQKIIELTAIYPKEVGLAYCALGLTGEAGEVAEKVKKLYRDNDFLNKKIISEDIKLLLNKELGDVLWYITAISNEIGISLEDIMTVNYNKLIQRRTTNTLHGSGDTREVTK